MLQIRSQIGCFSFAKVTQKVWMACISRMFPVSPVAKGSEKASEVRYVFCGYRKTWQGSAVPCRVVPATIFRFPKSRRYPAAKSKRRNPRILYHSFLNLSIGLFVFGKKLMCSIGFIIFPLCHFTALSFCCVTALSLCRTISGRLWRKTMRLLKKL